MYEEELMDSSDIPYHDDSDILFHIKKLMDEEQQLVHLTEKGSLTEEQRATLRQIEVYLDQCWDLLRQRHARRLAGLDPADARLHDEGSVELFPQ